METQSNDVDEEQAFIDFIAFMGHVWFGLSAVHWVLAATSEIFSTLKVQHAMADPEIQRMLHDPQDRSNDGTLT